MTTQRKGRLDQERALRPDSLVGSYFHGDERRSWQGKVVAEPHPGYYLVELFEWLAGSPNGQRLVHISTLGDWRFYDTAKEMTDYYERHPGMFKAGE